jgi:O-antigen/teichoic acid export membrane protein
MYRSVLLILSGNAFASVLLLARTLIVARLISVEDYGIAATFALSMAVVEMLSALGLQQQIVQAKDGNDPRLQAGLQGFQFMRGCFSGIVLFLLAAPIAQFLGVPEVTWAYQALAVVPVLNALVHFDVYRLNRRMVYLPGILSISVPALISVLILWPLAAIYDDWRVMLFSILVQSVVATVTSHLVAERRWTAILDRKIISQSLRFGWPLLANGLLLFLVFNGEKLIVGRELGMVDLAIFSMGFTLTLTPTLVMARSIQTFFLPQLSALKETAGQTHAEAEGAFASIARATLQASMVNGSLLVVAVLLIGGPIVHLLLGEKYGPLVPLMTGLAVMQALRVFKSGCAVVALSLAQTANAMVANMFRVAALPIAWLVLHRGGSLSDVIWIGTVAELAGFLASLLLVRFRARLRLRPMLPALAIAAGLMALACADSVLQSSVSPSSSLHWQIAGWGTLVFIVMIASMRDLVRYVRARNVTRFGE